MLLKVHGYDRGLIATNRSRAVAGNGSSLTYGSNSYSHGSSLFDITSGNNGSCGGSYLCTAGAGYDGPTGLGTPNGTGAF